MLEVKIVLEHEGEVHLLQQFVGFLRQAREDWGRKGGFDSPGVAADGETASEQESAPTEEQALAAIGATKVAEVPVITDADLEEGLMAFAKQHGTAKAVELLAEFGIKKLPDIAGKDRARLYAKLYA